MRFTLLRLEQMRIMSIFYYKVYELFRLHPEVKSQLWGGKFWSSGYYINTVGQYANEDTIQKYIKQQGDDPKKYKLFNKNQTRLFD